MIAVVPASVHALIRDGRPADAPALARTRVSSWHQAYRGLLPADELARVTLGSCLERFKATLEGPAPSIQVVEDGGDVFGFVWTGPQRDRSLPFHGEIYELYVDPACTGLGAGRRLLVAAIWRLVDLGLHPVMVWVLAGNPACGFYEACGGTPLFRRRIPFGRERVPAVAYGWTTMLPCPPPFPG
jgi:ribosomal protein S18 acetylase RimI-like enzyme